MFNDELANDKVNTNKMLYLEKVTLNVMLRYNQKRCFDVGCSRGYV